jgi:hypothetical protein
MNWNRRCHMLNDTKPCDAACGVLISNADMVHELSYQTMIYERHSIQLELDHWCSRIQPLFELVYPTCWKCLISPLFGHIRFLLGCCVCYHKLHYVNRLGVRQTLLSRVTLDKEALMNYISATTSLTSTFCRVLGNQLALGKEKSSWRR